MIGSFFELLGKVIAAVLIGVLALVVAVLALPLFLLVSPLLALAFLFHLSMGRKRRHVHADSHEAQWIQNFHADLVRMDKRIETLETILLERINPEGAAGFAARERTGIN